MVCGCSPCIKFNNCAGSVLRTKSKGRTWREEVRRLIISIAFWFPRAFSRSDRAKSIPPLVINPCAIMSSLNSTKTFSLSSGVILSKRAISNVICSISSSRKCLKISVETSLPTAIKKIAAFWRPVRFVFLLSI